jgi:hypothetical protein
MLFGNYAEWINNRYEKEDCVEDNSDEVLDVAVVSV